MRGNRVGSVRALETRHKLMRGSPLTYKTAADSEQAQLRVKLNREETRSCVNFVINFVMESNPRKLFSKSFCMAYLDL